jgi:hypothetical protein
VDHCYVQMATGTSGCVLVAEFLRRFLQRVLPKGFPRTRYFGWLANRRPHELLPLCRTLLAVASPPAVSKQTETAVWRCPNCGSRMRVAQRLTAKQIQREQSRRVQIVDSSKRDTLSGANSARVGARRIRVPCRQKPTFQTFGERPLHMRLLRTDATSPLRSNQS